MLALGAVLLTGPVISTARADEYFEFPVQNGIGMVCQINTDSHVITWFWYDTNGNWGVLGVQNY